MRARVCVCVCVCGCGCVLLELVGSAAFWINVPKDEPRIELDLAPRADILQGFLKNLFAGRR